MAGVDNGATGHHRQNAALAAGGRLSPMKCWGGGRKSTDAEP